MCSNLTARHWIGFEKRVVSSAVRSVKLRILATAAAGSYDSFPSPERAAWTVLESLWAILKSDCGRGKVFRQLLRFRIGAIAVLLSCVSVALAQTSPPPTDGTRPNTAPPDVNSLGMPDVAHTVGKAALEKGTVEVQGDNFVFSLNPTVKAAQAWVGKPGGNPVRLPLQIVNGKATCAIPVELKSEPWIGVKVDTFETTTWSEGSYKRLELAEKSMNLSGRWVVRGDGKARHFAERMTWPAHWLQVKGQRLGGETKVLPEGEYSLIVSCHFKVPLLKPGEATESVPQLLAVRRGTLVQDGIALDDSQLRHAKIECQRPIESGWRIAIDGKSFDAISERDRFIVFDEGALLRFAQKPDRQPDRLIDLISSATRWTVFVVHGTYGGTEEWPLGKLDDSSKTSFGRMLMDGLSPFQCEVVPLPWRSSVSHDDRLEAAERLARQIDDPSVKDHRIVLVGHSHGGNVCLAASGLCKRRIDMVITLGTPHVHICMKRQDGTPVALPVYCTPTSRRNCGKIISIGTQSDSVPEGWAGLRKGISEQQALSATEEWQKALNYPRLGYDSGPVIGAIEDAAGDRIVNQVSVSHHLAAATDTIELASEVAGQPAHHALHSCRLGYILGNLIADGCSKDGLQYLAGTVIPFDSDAGEPIDRQKYNTWSGTKGGYEHSGWVLDVIEASVKSRSKPSGENWDADGSWPDIMLEVTPTIGSSGQCASSMDNPKVSWKLPRHFPLSSPETASGRITAFDNDYLLGRDDMGSVDFRLTSEMPKESFEGTNFTMQMKWRKAHY